MHRFKLDLATEGGGQVVNLNPLLVKPMQALEGHGLLHLFAVGSTVALTTMEYEPGLVNHDLRTLMQRLIPDDARYEHEATWSDDNGHSHLRSALLGPDLTVPYTNRQLLTGEYQQIVLIDFDTRPRRRTVICSAW